MTRRLEKMLMNRLGIKYNVARDLTLKGRENLNSTEFSPVAGGSSKKKGSTVPAASGGGSAAPETTPRRRRIVWSDELEKECVKIYESEYLRPPDPASASVSACSLGDERFQAPPLTPACASPLKMPRRKGSFTKRTNQNGMGELKKRLARTLSDGSSSDSSRAGGDGGGGGVGLDNQHSKVQQLLLHHHHHQQQQKQKKKDSSDGGGHGDDDDDSSSGGEPLCKEDLVFLLQTAESLSYLPSDGVVCYSSDEDCGFDDSDDEDEEEDSFASGLNCDSQPEAHDSNGTSVGFSSIHRPNNGVVVAGVRRRGRFSYDIPAPIIRPSAASDDDSSVDYHFGHRRRPPVRTSSNETYVSDPSGGKNNHIIYNRWGYRTSSSSGDTIVSDPTNTGINRWGSSCCSSANNRAGGGKNTTTSSGGFLSRKRTSLVKLARKLGGQKSGRHINKDYYGSEEDDSDDESPPRNSIQNMMQSGQRIRRNSRNNAMAPRRPVRQGSFDKLDMVSRQANPEPQEHHHHVNVQKSGSSSSSTASVGGETAATAVETIVQC